MPSGQVCNTLHPLKKYWWEKWRVQPQWDFAPFPSAESYSHTKPYSSLLLHRCWHAEVPCRSGTVLDLEREWKRITYAFKPPVATEKNQPYVQYRIKPESLRPRGERYIRVHGQPATGTHVAWHSASWPHPILAVQFAGGVCNNESHSVTSCTVPWVGNETGRKPPQQGSWAWRERGSGAPSSPPASGTRDQSLEMVPCGPTTGWPSPALLTHSWGRRSRVPPLLQGTGSLFCPRGPSSSTLQSGLTPLGSPLQLSCHSLSLSLGSSIQPCHLTLSSESQQKGWHYLELRASTNNLLPSFLSSSWVSHSTSLFSYCLNLPPTPPQIWDQE